MVERTQRDQRSIGPGYIVYGIKRSRSMDEALGYIRMQSQTLTETLSTLQMDQSEEIRKGTLFLFDR